jgi:uncharacterized damage-inducible protein DinB
MPTLYRDILKTYVAAVQGATVKLVHDITEPESLVTIDGYHNHIKWLTGHLATVNTASVKALGGEAQFPSSWTEIFRRGAPTPPKNLTSPAYAEVREQLLGIHAQILDLIDGTDDDRLVKVVQIEREWDDSPMQAVSILAAHEFYHAGQMAVIRRTLGRDRSFG